MSRQWSLFWRGAEGVDMSADAPRRLTPIDRDRALHRLRGLTLGTAVAAVLAVSGMGYVAAASYAGKSSTSSSTSTPSAGSSSSTSSLQTTTQAPTTASSGTAVVTSGGS